MFQYKIYYFVQYYSSPFIRCKIRTPDGSTMARHIKKSKKHCTRLWREKPILCVRESVEGNTFWESLMKRSRSLNLKRRVQSCKEQNRRQKKLLIIKKDQSRSAPESATPISICKWNDAQGLTWRHRCSGWWRPQGDSSARYPTSAARSSV